MQESYKIPKIPELLVVDLKPQLKLDPREVCVNGVSENHTIVLCLNTHGLSNLWGLKIKLGFRYQSGLSLSLVLAKGQIIVNIWLFNNSMPTHLTNPSSSPPLVTQKANESFEYFTFL